LFRRSGSPFSHYPYSSNHHQHNQSSRKEIEMMTLDINRVAELFSLFADLEGESLRQWHGFCGASARALAARVKPEVGEESMEALCIAAAGLAYSDYLALRQGTRQRDGIKVGDISLSSSSRGEAADQKELRGHFLGGVAHLLAPDYAALIAVGDPR
jgi:hypothetical protein